MRNLLYLSSILAPLLLSSCSSKLENPDAVPAEQVLLLTANSYNLKSGGSTTKITARIPKDAGVIDISYSTTAGTFVHSAGKTIKQFADSLDGNYRYSNTLLKSDTSHGPVYLTAETGSVRKRIIITFIK